MNRQELTRIIRKVNKVEGQLQIMLEDIRAIKYVVGSFEKTHSNSLIKTQLLESENKQLRAEMHRMGNPLENVLGLPTEFFKNLELNGRNWDEIEIKEILPDRSYYKGKKASSCTRLHNALQNYDIKTVGDLKRVGLKRLLKDARNYGELSHNILLASLMHHKIQMPHE